jgi:hypothetical protein
MYLVNKILFAITVWFISASIVIVGFSYYITNPSVLNSHIDSINKKELLQAINDNDLKSEKIDYSLSLNYIVLESYRGQVPIEDFSKQIDNNITGISEWLQGDRNTIPLYLPTNSNELLKSRIDQTADKFIASHKPEMQVCSGEKTSQTQQNGYSLTDFCIPAQVRNDQIDLRSYVNAQDENVLNGLIEGDIDSTPKVTPEKVPFLNNWVSLRNTLATVRKSTPLVIITAIVLLALLYYTQKLDKEEVQLEVIYLLAYVSICTIGLSLLSILFTGELTVINFVQDNMLPGLDGAVSQIIGRSLHQSILSSLQPSLIAGGLLGLAALVNYILYSRKKTSELFENDTLKVNEHNVFEESILVTPPQEPRESIDTPLYNAAQVKKIEEIKDLQAAHNYEIDQDIKKERFGIDEDKYIELEKRVRPELYAEDLNPEVEEKIAEIEEKVVENLLVEEPEPVTLPTPMEMVALESHIEQSPITQQISIPEQVIPDVIPETEAVVVAPAVYTENLQSRNMRPSADMVTSASSKSSSATQTVIGAGKSSHSNANHSPLIVSGGTNNKRSIGL